MRITIDAIFTSSLNNLRRQREDLFGEEVPYQMKLIGFTHRYMRSASTIAPPSR